MKKIAVKVGTHGRIVIPSQTLKEKEIEEGDIVLLEITKADIREAR